MKRFFAVLMFFLLFIVGCEEVEDVGDSGDSVDNGNFVDDDSADTEDCIDNGDSVAPPAPHVIPTNQTKCYNNSEEITCPTNCQDFYGQDAQYPDAERIFTVQGDADKTVIDSMTNLEWQQDISVGSSRTCRYEDSDWHKCSWRLAKTYCSQINYAGYDDWRLPRVEELSTLPDYGQYTPAIDIAAFPDTPPSGAFWAYTADAEYTADFAWTVSFYGGYVLTTLPAHDHYVRCVRGTPYHPTANLIESGDTEKIVTDRVTDIIWTKEYMSKTWKEALNYCETLTYAGKSDWHLPNVNELKTLINYAKYKPASDFPDIPHTHHFWSSTTSAEKPHNVWTVDLGDGSLIPNYNDTHNSAQVSCIRVERD